LLLSALPPCAAVECARGRGRGQGPGLRIPHALFVPAPTTTIDRSTRPLFSNGPRQVPHAMDSSEEEDAWPPTLREPRTHACKQVGTRECGGFLDKVWCAECIS